MNAPAKPEQSPWEREAAEDRRMLQGWRGRRLLACRTVDLLTQIIGHLAEDNGVDPPPDRGLPHPPTIEQIGEMQNQAANLLRTILLWNDGRVSSSTLNRF